MSNLTAKLSNYSFENHKIRTILKESEMWFIAEDICSALKLTNVTMALKPLDNDERSKFNLGRQGEVNIVNESGMYTLILRCREAVKKGTAPYRFRKWVTSEVLPTIRKTGSYTITINAEQQQIIKQSVNNRAYKTGETRGAIYAKMYNYFKIPKYQDLPVAKFNDAIKWIGGEYVISSIGEDNLYDFSSLLKVADHMYFNIERVYPVLEASDSSFKSTFFSIIHEHKRVINRVREILNKETLHIDDRGLNNKWNAVLPYVRLKAKC